MTRPWSTPRRCWPRYGMGPLLTAPALVSAGFAMISNTHQYSPFLTKTPQMTTQRYSQLIHSFISRGGIYLLLRDFVKGWGRNSHIDILLPPSLLSARKD